MARAAELPELVKEFTDMSKEYLLQETVEPAKRLGKYAGFSLGAGALFAFGALFIGIAVTRAIVHLMPDGSPYWEALGYLISVIVLGGVAGLLVQAGSRGPKKAV
jgi:hypothetical protein